MAARIQILAELLRTWGTRALKGADDGGIRQGVIHRHTYLHHVLHVSYTYIHMFNAYIYIYIFAHEYNIYIDMYMYIRVLYLNTYIYMYTYLYT